MAPTMSRRGGHTAPHEHRPHERQVGAGRERDHAQQSGEPEDGDDRGHPDRRGVVLDLEDPEQERGEDQRLTGGKAEQAEVLRARGSTCRGPRWWPFHEMIMKAPRISSHAAPARDEVVEGLGRTGDEQQGLEHDEGEDRAQEVLIDADDELTPGRFVTGRDRL